MPEYALEQLRAGGVLEAVRIASAGFPTRKAFRSVVCLCLALLCCCNLLAARTRVQ